MTQEKTLEQNIEISDVIVEALQNKKGKQIVKLDLRELHTAPVDYFIICHGTSDTQVEALARGVEEEVEKNLKEKPWHREGFENREWVLLDYVNVVVHIFLKDKRDFYGIEDLWIDAIREDFESED